MGTGLYKEIFKRSMTFIENVPKSFENLIGVFQQVLIGPLAPTIIEHRLQPCHDPGKDGSNNRPFSKVSFVL